MTRSLPLGASLLAALVFVLKALRQAPLALALFAAAIALHLYSDRLGLGHGGRIATMAPLLLAALIAEGALYRVGVSDNAKSAKALGLGPLGLQISAAELRLLGAGLQVALFLAVIGLALGVVLVIAANGLQISVNRQEWLSAPAGWRLLAFVGLAAAAGWVVAQLAIRLSLYKAATVARRRMVTVSALGLSEHNFWRLLLGLVLTSAPMVALALWRAKGPDGGLWTGAIVAGVLALVQTPLTVGFLSEAYKRLEYWRDHPGEG